MRFLFILFLFCFAVHVFHPKTGSSDKSTNSNQAIGHNSSDLWGKKKEKKEGYFIYISILLPFYFVSDSVTDEEGEMSGGVQHDSRVAHYSPL